MSFRNFVCMFSASFAVCFLALFAVLFLLHHFYRKERKVSRKARRENAELNTETDFSFRKRDEKFRINTFDLSIEVSPCYAPGFKEQTKMNLRIINMNLKNPNYILHSEGKIVGLFINVSDLKG